MENRILLTYATRADSTTQIAGVIGEELSKRGYVVELVPVKAKPVVEGYTAVVIGSAIRMGNWLPEAVDFIKKNQAQLNAIPTALFSVHMLNSGDDLESKTNRLAYLNNVRPLVNAVDEVFFTGKMDLKRLSFTDRLIAKAVKAVNEDRRDWDKIRSWANTIFAPSMPGKAVHTPPGG